MSDWYYADGEEAVGPVPEDRVIAFLRRVPRPADVLVWQREFENWKRVSDVPQLLRAIDRPPPLPTKRPTAEQEPLPGSGKTWTGASWVNECAKIDETERAAQKGLTEAFKAHGMDFMSMPSAVIEAMVKEAIATGVDATMEHFNRISAGRVGTILHYQERSKRFDSAKGAASPPAKGQAGISAPEQELRTPQPNKPSVIQPQAMQFEDVPNLRGIAGWLMVLAIGQVLGLLVLVLRTAEYLGTWIGNKDDLEVLKKWPVAAFGESALNVGVLVFGTYTVVLFFRQSRKFPTYFIYQWIIALLVPFIDLVWTAFSLAIYTGGSPSRFIISSSDLAAQFIPQSILITIMAVVWIAYIRRSKRVANTFVN